MGEVLLTMIGAGVVALALMAAAVALVVVSVRRSVRRRVRRLSDRGLDAMSTRICDGLAAGGADHLLPAYGRLQEQARRSRRVRDHARVAAEAWAWSRADDVRRSAQAAVSRRAWPASTGSRTPDAPPSREAAVR
ncbi:MAG: hypothetical protein MUE51_08115 [Thermoleophilia bacterium]|jgi:hypothetical protein|nr:hypothetical protein [Thermoleophilia bacterium]